MIEELKTTNEKKQTEAQRAYDFVSKIIDSCTDTFHMQCAAKLTGFYKDKYFDKYSGKSFHEKLLNQLVDKIPGLTEAI